MSTYLARIEYEFDRVGLYDDYATNQMLGRRSKAGWELVSVVKTDVSYAHFYFSRKVYKHMDTGPR